MSIKLNVTKYLGYFMQMSMSPRTLKKSSNLAKLTAEMQI